ncbi:MAG TPA: hypothetical protein PLH09_11515, partial [Lentimicrobium sp.]|nr:hypothetical protein [Lentimicrobium sp.]
MWFGVKKHTSPGKSPQNHKKGLPDTLKTGKPVRNHRLSVCNGISLIITECVGFIDILSQNPTYTPHPAGTQIPC